MQARCDARWRCVAPGDRLRPLLSSVLAGPHLNAELLEQNRHLKIAARPLDLLVFHIIDHAHRHADVFPGGRDAGKLADLLAHKVSFHNRLSVGDDLNLDLSPGRYDAMPPNILPTTTPIGVGSTPKHRAVSVMSTTESYVSKPAIRG